MVWSPQRNLLDVEKQQVIMVDQNERDQAVEGIDAAQVTEIIDHHRIGALETTNPIYFRNQPLGCTATIVTQLYHENRVEIEPAIAGLLCSAILSDTADLPFAHLYADRPLHSGRARRH